MKKLVITEKPSVARDIANVICTNPVKQTGYIEDDNYIVSWCFGHLVELKAPNDYDAKYKTWNMADLPIIPRPFEYIIKKDCKEQFATLSLLLSDENVSSVIEATDAGREGELIFRLVYDICKCNKPIERLWISSMTNEAIKTGFKNLRPVSEYENLYKSALGRQRADWLVGINGTRALTLQYGGKMIKVGRVQSPALAMIVERDLEIDNFKSTTYYYLKASNAEKFISATSEKMTKEEAESKLLSCENEEAIVTSKEVEKKKEKAPKLFDLTSLQREANKLLGFSAKKTLDLLQSLYEKKLTTYPRTDSSYLTEDMEEEARDIIKAIVTTDPFKNFLPPVHDMNIACLLNSKKVTDHHAIIPTMDIASTDLSDTEIVSLDELKLLKIIAARTLAAVSSNYEYESIKVSLLVNTTEFKQTGRKELNPGFKAYELALKKNLDVKSEAEKDSSLINVELDERLEVNVTIEEGQTKAPKRFSEATLLAAMERAGSKETSDEAERKGIGTPATRAEVIEKLIKDNYVLRSKKNLISTELGKNVVKALPDVIKSPLMTAEWENKLIEVNKGNLKLQDFMKDILNLVELIVNSKPSKELVNTFKIEREVLGLCPVCGKKIVKGKHGAFCEGKCGLQAGKLFGKALTDEQIINLLDNKFITLRGLVSKQGNEYNIKAKLKGAIKRELETEDHQIKVIYNYEVESSHVK